MSVCVGVLPWPVSVCVGVLPWPMFIRVFPWPVFIRVFPWPVALLHVIEVPCEERIPVGAGARLCRMIGIPSTILIGGNQGGGELNCGIVRAR
jgi:hypothetical protein